MKQIGITPENLMVMDGIYAFYETHGLPLSDILQHLWQHDAIPNWYKLVADMVRAGRPLERSIEVICVAVEDAGYPIEWQNAILTRLKRIC